MNDINLKERDNKLKETESEKSADTKTVKRQAGLVNWENVSQYIMLALVFFLPIFALPFSEMTLGLSKSLLLNVLIIAAAVFYLISILQKGAVKIPKSFALLALVAVLIVNFASTLLSKNVSVSLFGTGSEVGTFASFLVLSVGLFLVVSLFQSERKALLFFLCLVASSFLVFIFQAFHSFFGITLYPWNIFSSKVGNLLGSWNELAIFFGFIALEAVIFFEFFSVGRRMRALLVSLMVMSFVVMAVVNFTAAWVVFGSFLLVILVYLYSTLGGTRNFARLPLFIILIAMFFILARTLVGDFVSSVNLGSVDVRPSWGATFQVSKNVLGEGVKNVFLGSGPNTFTYDWLKHKSADLNQTVFWNTRFTNGIGFIPSLVSSSGIVSVLMWLAFLAIFIYYGLKSISYSGSEITKCLLMATFFGASYLWVFSFIYVPSNFLFALSFLTAGLFIALLLKVQRIKVREISFLNSSTLGFVSALFIVLLMIAGVASFYTIFQKYWAAYIFGDGLVALNVEGNLDKAENNFIRAARFDAQDRYSSALGEVGLLRLSQIVNSQIPIEQKRLQFQQALASTIQQAQLSTKLNSLEPLNWMTLGRVYESIIPFQVDGARQYALSAYNEAQNRNPFDPQTRLASARVEIQAGDTVSARNFIDLALRVKGDYTPAIFLLAQIEAKDGNLDAAIQRTAQARFLAPNDTGVLFQLGLLYYQKKDYENARQVFEDTVNVNPNYSNARYFLGLVYDYLGRKKDAINQFTRIKELNPDNTEVQTILSNLKSGDPALRQISPPKPVPENREEPPVKEDKNDKSKR